ncbi:MAG: hypothetical protein VX498_13910 [Myxococcota bacterium]|nr:hypothetical protein [Myxococcota bacterium]
MPRAAVVALIALGLALGLLGCDVPLAEEGSTWSSEATIDTTLLESLAGAWKIDTITESDCPQVLRRALPSGRTSWSVDGEQLLVEPVSSQGAAMEFWADDENSLSAVVEVSVPGCTGTESLSLEIDRVTSGWTVGSYLAVMEHEGSPSCRSLAKEAGLPDRCTTYIEWRAWRLQ